MVTANRLQDIPSNGLRMFQNHAAHCKNAVYTPELRVKGGPWKVLCRDEAKKMLECWASGPRWSSALNPHLTPDT